MLQFLPPSDTLLGLKPRSLQTTGFSVSVPSIGLMLSITKRNTAPLVIFELASVSNFQFICRHYFSLSVRFRFCPASRSLHFEHIVRSISFNCRPHPHILDNFTFGNLPTFHLPLLMLLNLIFLR